MSNKIQFNLLRRLNKNPDCTQRELAQEMDVSLGKLNYCLKKLVQKGWVKAGNFRKNKNKRSYSYLLTPSGVEEKGKLTIKFLRQKLVEYEQLQQEIRLLEVEVVGLGDNKSNKTDELPKREGAKP